MNIEFFESEVLGLTVVQGSEGGIVLPYQGTIRDISSTRYEVVFSNARFGKVECSTSYYSNHKSAVKAIKNHIQECLKENLKNESV